LHARSRTPANVGNHGRIFLKKRFFLGQTAFSFGTLRAFRLLR
jgi:hypothetical protein